MKVIFRMPVLDKWTEAIKKDESCTFMLQNNL